MESSLRDLPTSVYHSAVQPVTEFQVGTENQPATEFQVERATGKIFPVGTKGKYTRGEI
jgi:hypothetical protein